MSAVNTFMTNALQLQQLVSSTWQLVHGSSKNQEESRAEWKRAVGSVCVSVLAFAGILVPLPIRFSKARLPGDQTCR